MIRPIMGQGAAPRRGGQARRLAGFTLPELVVVLAIGAVLLSQALPAMTAMVNTQRAISLGYAFVSVVNLTRNEAIKRNARAVLCKSGDAVSCTLQGGWEQGWISFHDVNNNAVLDAGEQVIERHGGVSEGLSLTGNQPVANYVSFSATGSAKYISGAFQAGTFTLCLDPVSEADVRKFVLNSTGRLRTQKGAAADCDSG